MIVVDASALLAILFEEPETADLLARLRSGPALSMTAVNYWEVLVRAEKVYGPSGRRGAEQLIAELGVAIRGATPELSRLAADAHARFGKPASAALNLGDCFAYALAQREGAPLLFKGADFSRTDVLPA
jgi:ribonuclease VapC